MGRPKGKPNKLTRDIKERAAFWGDAALEKVVGLMGSQDERVSLSAAQTILDRAYGKAPQAQIIEGNPTKPVRHEHVVTFRSGV